MPWVGGINTSVDPGVLNSQELVQADNVQFSTTGARIKREALTYLDNAVAAPDLRSSSGFIRTLKWTTSTLIGVRQPDMKLVVGEQITVTGNTSYNVTKTPILSVTGTAEVTQITCTADTAGSLAGKYFEISAGDSGLNYYVWYKVSGVGSDPAVMGRTGVEVDISTNASDSTVATATAAALSLVNASMQFSASAVGAVVTSTNLTQGYTVDALAGTSGFTVLVTTQGGFSITYMVSGSFSESLTAAALMLKRASAVIMTQDYWRFDGVTNIQLLVYATTDFQLFVLDADGRRTQVLGQGQTTQVVVSPSSAITTGHYFLIDSPNFGNQYYIWYNKAGGGADPLVPGRTGIEVDIGSSDTATTVATETAAAFAANPDFTAMTNTALVMKVDITTVPDVAGSLASTHLPISSSASLIHYYLWYKVSGTGADPDIAGSTGIEVDITTGATAAQVATATAAAINQIANTGLFTALALGSVVTVRPAPMLPPLLPPGTTETISAGTTGFTVSPYTAGVIITAKNPGIAVESIDGNSGFVLSTTAFGATAPVGPVQTIRTLVFNERLQIYLSGIGNFPILFNPDENAKYQLMGTNYHANGGLSMPDASFAFQFLSRVWTNEKTTDNLHYCETFNETKWLGVGDSGLIPVAQGDGDPEGVTNGYVYKGRIIVGKKDSRHSLIGDSPETFQIQRISSGMGNEGAMAVPVDEMDVLFMSSRGVHSQAVTDAYGETNAMYLSADIKPTFNSFEPSARKLTQGAYIPELNSVAFAITESGESSQNAVWLYNIEIQAPNKQKPGTWYRWPDISCTALSRRFIGGVHKLLFGTADGRVIQAQTDNNFTDFDTTPIPFQIKSGTIYPGDDPQLMKAFHRITMIYRPKGNFEFTVMAKIDNQATQSFLFNQISGLDLLGSTFILGVSILGSSNTLAPFTFQMEGYGRGITLTVSQDNSGQQVEIWGFVIEYENVGLEQEVH